ncbi:YfhO family protein [Streptomyces vastus]|uniref:YfhO family protein n=1 Tax=Streptomyces vastus TaxID=285451 RepID=UPI0031D67363
MKTHLAGPGLAAAIAMAAFVNSGALRGTYPFGDRSRAVNDLGNQFVPFHAHLWDLLHGTSSGDLFFNWNSAFGVPYWADFVSYLGNPFSLLVAGRRRRPHPAPRRRGTGTRRTFPRATAGDRSPTRGIPNPTRFLGVRPPAGGTGPQGVRAAADLLRRAGPCARPGPAARDRPVPADRRGRPVPDHRPMPPRQPSVRRRLLDRRPARGPRRKVRTPVG